MQSNGAGMEDQQDALDSFVCPINLTVMRDPVVAADGFSYEREAIERWLRSNQSSPKTNLRLHTVALFPNHALKQAIEEYRTRSQGARTSLGPRAGPGQEGLRSEAPADDALEDLPENGVFIYLVTYTACVYFRPNFSAHFSAFDPGSFVVADRREYGAGGAREYGASRTIFARLEDGHYVAENRFLQRVEVNTALRVYRATQPIGLRESPTRDRSAMTGTPVYAGEMVSSKLSFVDPISQVTYLRPEGSSYWLFTEDANGVTCMPLVALERPGAAAAPFIYEAKENLRLRMWPHWNYPCEPSVVVMKGTFKKAESRVRDSSGHWHIRVQQGGIHGWLPVHSNVGGSVMNDWTSPPRPLCEGPAGNRIQVCLGYHNDSWLVILDHETSDGIEQKMYWRDIPMGLDRHLRKLHARGRIIRRASFSQLSHAGWYLSFANRDGSDPGWQCSGTDRLDEFREEADVDCAVAFGKEMPYGFGDIQFFIGYSSGNASWRSVPPEMIDAWETSRHNVRSALFTSSGQWLLLYHGGARKYALDEHPHMRREIDRGPRGSGSLCSAALSEGTGSWIVIREHEYAASQGTDDRLTGHLTDFYRVHYEKRHERRHTMAAYQEALCG